MQIQNRAKLDHTLLFADDSVAVTEHKIVDCPQPEFDRISVKKWVFR